MNLTIQAATLATAAPMASDALDETSVKPEEWAEFSALLDRRPSHSVKSKISLAPKDPIFDGFF